MSSEPERTEPTMGRMAPQQGLIHSFLSVDRLVDGRRMRLLLGVSLIQAVLAPAMDRAVGTVRDSEIFGGVARDLGSVSFAGFQALSLLGALVTLTTVLLMLGGRMAAFFTEASSHGPIAVLKELILLVRMEWTLLGKRGGAERLLFGSMAAYIGMVTLRDTLRICRFIFWEGPISWFGLEKTFLAVPFGWMYSFENVLELFSVGAVGLAVLGVAAWVSKKPRPVQPSNVMSARVASGLPSVINVHDVGSRNQVASAFHGDLLRRALASMAEWRGDLSIVDEGDLQRRLKRHLADAGFSVASEVWIDGRNRVDLTLDDALAIELKFGRLRANERNRVMGQSTTYAKNWAGRGPVLIVCVGAPDERLDEVSESVSAWNRTLPEKETAGMALPAPILVLQQVGDGPSTAAATNAITPTVGEA